MGLRLSMAITSGLQMFKRIVRGCCFETSVVCTQQEMSQVRRVEVARQHMRFVADGDCFLIAICVRPVLTSQIALGNGSTRAELRI